MSFQQNITRGQGVGLMATTLLGTGVFILPQLTVEIAGQGALMAWCLLTLAILPLVRVFAELGRQFPHAAGPAYFVEQGFGEVFGRIIGLMFVFVVPIGTVAAMVMVMEFATAMIDLDPALALGGELLLLLGIWGLNIRAVQLSARLQLGLTLAITAVVLVMLGLFSMNNLAEPAPVAAPAPQINGASILAACSLAFWSFLGIEALSHFSAEFKDPQRDFVPAMLIATLVVGLLYVACAWLVVDQPEMASLSMVAAFDELLGQGGRWVIGLLGVASGLATINVYIGSVARLCWSLSRDNVMPRSLSQLNASGVPQRAANVVISVVALSTLARHWLDLSFEQFLGWSNGVFVIIYGACMLAALKLLDAKFHWASISGLLVCAAIGIGLGAGMIYGGILLLCLLPLLLAQQKRLQRKACNPGVSG